MSKNNSKSPAPVPKIKKDKKGWESVEVVVKPPTKVATDYHKLVSFIREKKPAEIRLNPNLIEGLRKQHHALYGNFDEDTQGLQQEAPLIIEGCKLVPSWDANSD